MNNTDYYFSELAKTIKGLATKKNREKFSDLENRVLIIYIEQLEYSTVYGASIIYRSAINTHRNIVFSSSVETAIKRWKNEGKNILEFYGI